MPALEVMDLNQRAVLWPRKGTDLNGQPTVDVALRREIKVRWNAKSHEVLAADGSTIAADGLVVVKQDVAVGSILWLGALDDIPGTSYVPQSGLMQVIRFNDTKDLKGRFTRRTLSVMRWNDRLPVG